MPWHIYAAHFLGAVFLANAVPHFVQGISGKPFRTPFAPFQGRNLSSPLTNILWAWANLVIAYLLLVQVGPLAFGSLSNMMVFAVGAIVCSVALSLYFASRPSSN
ncbi:hypothetical protein DUT91_14415 [Phyllobacterium salinisoli]|uniref:Uncharacterized protein n=1 Tax=Phyllobacterium salinisoli TaxID=1899321 RepID=A0A368K2L9_9HYPH|nr:hypothetical protein [Phyllobacterium salinisoli]RCS23461.1 hypothetical protein DUT91_14415 [Phyllobacterium salinisoli]